MNLHKLIVKFLFAAMITITFGSSAVLAASTGVTNESSINVRASNSTESDILDKLAYNTSVTIVDKVDDWYKISVADGQHAFISAQYINIVSADATVTGNGVNVRKGPSTTSDIITQLNSGDVVTATGISGDFLQVTVNGEKAYMSKNFLSGSLLTLLSNVDAPVQTANNDAQPTYAVVAPDDGLNLRDNPSLEGAVLQALAKGEAIDVLESGSEWIKVKADTDVVGYVNKQYVSLHTGVKPVRESAPAATSLGQQIIDYGKKFLGTPYVWGGTSLTKGVDCSGFVYSVYKHFGYTLNRSSASMAANGVSVKKSELRVGDIILFDTNGSNNGRISHVGIYMGDGRFIHSSSSSKSYSVTISSLNEAYYSKAYVSARRIIK